MGSPSPEARSVGPVKVPAEYTYIDSQDLLGQWVAESKEALDISGETRVCLDTEADSLHHYREKLCLIQVACAGRFALVDPLAVPDVSVLLAMLDEYEVWFHGADYDLTMLRRTYEWAPKRVFDTQIAARLVGLRQFGYAALVREILGVELSKASQKADWSLRPLPTVMLNYAVDDVNYLLPVASVLVAKLKELERHDWFVQSCQSLQSDVAARSMAPKEDPWRVQGSGRLRGKGMALLRELWLWREKVAEKRDLPCYRVMSNKQMISFAETFEFGEEPAPPRGWRPQWKESFRTTLDKVESMSADEWPKRPKKAKGRLSEDQRELVDRILQKRNQVAESLNIEPSLLGSRSTMEGIVARPIGELPNLMPWQKAALADVLEG